MIENDKVIVLHSGEEMAQFMLGPLYTPATEASARVGSPSRLKPEYSEPFLKGGVFGYLDDKVVVTDLPPAPRILSSEAPGERCLKA